MTDNQVFGAVLADGFIWATWSIERAGGDVTMVIRHLSASKSTIAAVAAEAEGALAFLEPAAADRDVRFAPAE